MQRFRVMGSGTLALRTTKNEHTFAGRYREADGTYREAALAQITRVFGGDPARPEARVSLRLVELLSAVQQMAGGGEVVVSSGYRSPSYNRKLRDRGGTVAKSSLHQYGMAADLRVEGFSSRRLWRMARKRRMGGAGYYGSPWIHLDVGRTRAWTQRSASKYVRSGVSDHNKRIMLVARYDRYLPGERVTARFIRMTAFPVGVRSAGFELQRRTGDDDGEGERWERVGPLDVTMKHAGKGKCPEFKDILSMTGVSWTLPADLSPGRYRVKAAFCNRKWDDMPAGITSEPLEVLARPGQPHAGSDSDRTDAVFRTQMETPSRQPSAVSRQATSTEHMATGCQA